MAERAGGRNFVLDAAAVVRCLHRTGNLHLILVDDIVVGLRVALLVVHFPAECAEEGIEVVETELGLNVGAGPLGVHILAETRDEIEEDGRDRHQAARMAGGLGGSMSGAAGARLPFNLP